MNIRKYIAGVLSLAIFTACEKNVIIDVPPHEPMLVINAVNHIDADSVEVKVGKSVDVLKHKSGSDLTLNNVSVILKQQGKQDVTLHYNIDTKSYRGKADLKNGGIYRIEAKAEGYKTAIAETSVPTSVEILSIERYKEVKVDIDGNNQDEIRIKFNDPIDENDFYIIYLNDAGYSADPQNPLLDSFHYHYIGCINVNDPSVESIYDEPIDQYSCFENNGIFFRDDLFNGKTKELILYVTSSGLQSNTVGGVEVFPEIELHHVKEDYFKYIKSREKSIANNGNPFAEPSNIYTNVENGYGIFGFISSSIIEIK